MLKLNVEVITPAVAAEYLKLNKGNRKPNNGQVAYYAKMMQNGEWELNGEAIKFNVNGNLADGQHRLMACLEANVPFETLVVRDVEEKVFDTLDQGWLRQKNQVFSIANIPNSHKISSGINRYICMKTKRMTSLGVHLVANSHSKNEIKTSPRELLEVYNAEPNFWQEIHKLSASMYARCKIMKVTDIMAIIAHLNKTCNYELGYVVAFFEQLFYEERTELGVIRRLRQKLINDCMSSIKMTSQMRTQLIRKTWDCYKAHKDPQILKWVKGVEEERPFE